jgi:hypothetical protein
MKLVPISLAGPLLIMGLVALLVAGPALAAPAPQEEEERLGPIAQLQKDLLGAQKNLSNVRMRLRGNMAGISSDGTTADGAPRRPPTPIEACCQSNIDRVNSKIHSMNRMLERLDVYYAEREQTEALAALDRIRGELNAVARGVAILKMAGTQDRAMQALHGLFRPSHELTKALIALGECCPVDDAAFEAESQRR